MVGRPPGVLLVHNYYQQPGGEDQAFAAEAALLEDHGHRVLRYTTHNERIADISTLALVAATLWNRASARALQDLVRRERPKVVHFHNTFPLVSPAAYAAAYAEGVAVVQTLHNYRLLCPNALFFRGGQVCEDCLRKSIPWPGVLHACYRGSRAASGTVAAMLILHRALGTWVKRVDRYIALTEFSKSKFVAGGLPADKIAVKPNFLEPDPGMKPDKGDFFLFVGRLDGNKGVETLLGAWKEGRLAAPLHVVGDGALATRVVRAAAEHPQIRYLGRLDRSAVLQEMHAAYALVIPSLLYENFPVAIVEAFACGLPVIASRLGAMAEIVEDRRTGLLFTAGDPQDLAAKIRWAWAHPAAMARMGKQARDEYERKYTGARNYEQLMVIYEQAMALASQRRRLRAA